MSWIVSDSNRLGMNTACGGKTESITLSLWAERASGHEAKQQDRQIDSSGAEERIGIRSRCLFSRALVKIAARKVSGLPFVGAKKLGLGIYAARAGSNLMHRLRWAISLLKLIRAGLPQVPKFFCC